MTRALLPLPRETAFMRAVRNMNPYIYAPFTEHTGTTLVNYAPARQGEGNGTVTGAVIGLPGLLGRYASFDGVDDFADGWGNFVQGQSNVGIIAVTNTGSVPGTANRSFCAETTTSASSTRQNFRLESGLKLNTAGRAPDTMTVVSHNMTGALTSNTWYIIGLNINVPSKLATFYVNGAIDSTVTLSSSAYTGTAYDNTASATGVRVARTTSSNFGVMLIQHLALFRRNFTLEEFQLLSKIANLSP